MAGTINSLLAQRAHDQPERTAYIFLRDGSVEHDRLTWRELDRKARAIGAALARMARPGERALLLYPQSLEYVAAFFGCLYAGVIAVPAYAPRANKGGERIQAIAADAEAAVALTTTECLPSSQTQLSRQPGCEHVHWLATDELDAGTGPGWEPLAVGPDSIAYLQYTSGSTSVPRGVVISHSNVMHNLLDQARGWREVASPVFVTWLPIFHDLGLVFGILQPLYQCAPAVVMPPVSFIQRPARWLRAISNYGGTHSGGPNFAYDLCVRKIRPEDRDGLNLGAWSVAINGAEPVRRETLERFAAAFGAHGFRADAFCPAYGLAESTLKVSCSPPGTPPLFCHFDLCALEKNRVVETTDNGDARTLTACGVAGGQVRVEIVRPETGERCGRDEVGEIWVSGPSVARGYWKRPRETAEVFGARVAGSDGRAFLRTGDLGFVRHEQLFIAGRLKDLIIIRGQNHYPQDIELTAEKSHPALRPGGAAAFSVDAGGEERLVIAEEVERGNHETNPREIVEATRQAVAEEHELQAWDVVLIEPGGLPRTSSGKLQRAACHASYLASRLPLWTALHRGAS